MKEQGLFYPDGSFRTREQVSRKVILDKLQRPQVIQRTDFPPERDFPRWTEIITRQQEERQELFGIPEHVDIEIQTREPVVFVPIGDIHAGGSEVNYLGFAKDIDIIREMGFMVATFGDLTDSYFFMPEVSEQLIAGDEQILYMQSALAFMAEDGLLLAGWGGDHDMWAKDKSGAHTLYQGFRERYGAHYLEGVSYLTLHLTNEDGGVAYPIVGAHRHKGYSVYNDAHAALRQLRDEGIAPDSKHCISITAHKHIKAYLHQIHKLHGGEEVNFHCLALGAYKESDRYSRKRGWPRMGDDSQGAFGIIMYPNEQKVDVCWDLQEARDKLLKVKGGS